MNRAWAQLIVVHARGEAIKSWQPEVVGDNLKPQTWKRGKAEKKKAYTTTTERKSFGELFWPQRITFQVGGGYQKPYENQEKHIYHRNLSSVAPIFFGKEKFFTGAGRCMLSLKIFFPGKDPNPQDKIQHLDFTTDPRRLYYKTLPCAFYRKNVRSKAVFGP